RDADREIDEALTSRQFLLLLGPPGSGKTRTAYEAARRILGKPFVIRPLDLGASYSETALDPSTPFLLWLDDIDRWLEGRLVVDEELLTWIDSNPNVQPIATINDQTFAGLEHAGPKRIPLFERTHRIQLGQTLSPQELDRARSLYREEEFTGSIGESLTTDKGPTEEQEEGRPEPTPTGWSLPSPRIATDIWTTQDQLGYNLYADALTRFLLHPQTIPPITIAIKGPWGSGKTSLMRMIREQIDPHPEAPFATLVASRPVRLKPLTNREVLKGRWERPASASQHPGPGRFQIGAPIESPGKEWQPTVWFNPWTRQAIELPWAGLAHEIVTQVVDRVGPGARERFWLDVREDKDAPHHAPPAVAQKLRRALIGELLPA
ncbi:MAG: P-loop NTPase fold protein, partial [Acidimicrobiia bacterium]